MLSRLVLARLEPPAACIFFYEGALVARFRLSSHFLMVEKGRHLTPRIAWNARRCTRCTQGQIDDEYHMLFECDAFQAQRQAVSPLDFLPGDLTSSSLADFADLKVCKFVSVCMNQIES